MAQQNMYDWRNATQQQLANLPQINAGNGMQALQNQKKPLRTRKNPNPKFPRARNWWEGVKENGSNIALGGAAGAGTGAAIGSLFPGAGTAIGAGVGGVAGILASLFNPKSETLFGNPDEIQQIQNYTPEEQEIFRYLQGLGIMGLQNPYAGFEPIEQQSRNQFSQNTVPNLAERFASMGNNALSSPTFSSQLGIAGAGLEADLATQKAGYGQQQIGQILQMLQLGLQPKFDNLHRPQSNGLAQNLLLGLAGSAPDFLKTYAKNKAHDKWKKDSGGE